MIRECAEDFNVLAKYKDHERTRLATLFFSKGLLHDCHVASVQHDGIGLRLDIDLQDVNESFSGLSEYPGAVPCRIWFLGASIAAPYQQETNARIFEAEVSFSDEDDVRPSITTTFWPEGRLNSQNLMQCMDACTHRDLCITSGNDGTHSGPNDPHLSGQAIDIGKNSNPGLNRNVMQQCFTQCTSQNPLGSYGQEEGNHYHLQTRPGRGGAHGFAPGVH